MPRSSILHCALVPVVAPLRGDVGAISPSNFDKAIVASASMVPTGGGSSLARARLAPRVFLCRDPSKSILADMELDLEGEHADRSYALLVSLVTPRPIAWVTSLSLDGHLNAAPFSFFNALGANPPIIGFCPGDRDDGHPKDTARNVRATHEFVVNLVDEAVAEAMNETSASFPYGQSELEAVGLTTAPSSFVKPPRIAEAPASLECTEWGTLQIGENRLIIGFVKRVHVREELIDRETLRIRDERFYVIGRMASPNWYCRTRDRFEMVRPK